MSPITPFLPTGYDKEKNSTSCMFYVDNSLEKWLLDYINDGFYLYIGIGTVQKTDNKKIDVKIVYNGYKMLKMIELQARIGKYKKIISPLVQKRSNLVVFKIKFESLLSLSSDKIKYITSRIRVV